MVFFLPELGYALAPVKILLPAFLFCFVFLISSHLFLAPTLLPSEVKYVKMAIYLLSHGSVFQSMNTSFFPELNLTAV